ncbi:uncharacterized protein LOC110233918 [Exaiptasia diaphana]|uniref:Uncharacterized protein n=1 Tax=Exaiptasia diaphana TaxID=2652724 RepID=A0A913WVX0_EXADI|nr:uncharacterized protein LOC110233918 [Exaiptasia diaphana]KXJ17524.1 hypothetical protein AC249_AIPGENE2461 [Exaiptasia diaphana]
MADNELRLSTFGLLEQIAILGFINGGETGKNLYKAFVTGRIGYEVYKRVSVTKADLLRYQTILKVSEYCQKNPKASEAQKKAMLEKEIKAFAEQVAQL